MLRFMRASAGFLICLTIVFVPPAVAVWWWQRTGWKLPSRATFDAWVAEPMNEISLAALIAVPALALWLLLVATAMASLIRHIQQLWARLRRVTLPTPAQATATSLAGAAVFGVPAASYTTTAPDVVPGTPDQPLTSAPQHLTPPTPDEHAEAVEPGGVTLPDGSWLPPQTAQAVTLAAAVGWLRHRRDYRPGPFQAGDDVPQLPASVAAIQQQAPAGPHTPTGDAALLPALLPAGGIGLSGAGAADAARGILITALLTPAITHVVTTTAMMTTLLDRPAPSSTALDGLHLAADLDTALAHLAVAPTTGHQRQILIAAAPPGQLAERLHQVVHAGGHTAVLLGAWTPGPNHTINADGTTAPPNGRWCVLSSSVAADLYTVAVHSRGQLAFNSSPATREDPVRPRQSRSRHNPAPHTPRAALRLAVLGSPELTWQGTPVGLRRVAAQQALVLLAVHHPDGVSTRQLGTTLWPAEPAHATTNRVYTTISELRRTLHTHTGTPVIQRDHDRYRLNPDHINVDLWHFRHALSGLNGTPQPDHHSDSHQLMDLYTGELGGDRDWPWITAHRNTLRRHVLDALIIIADSAAPADELAILEQALTVDDCNETIVRRLATAYTRHHNTSAVAELIRDYRLRLAAQGLNPSEEFGTFPADTLS
jgi:DNA-binding SARP family transcriptional activator